MDPQVFQRLYICRLGVRSANRKCVTSAKEIRNFRLANDINLTWASSFSTRELHFIPSNSSQQFSQLKSLSSHRKSVCLFASFKSKLSRCILVSVCHIASSSPPTSHSSPSVTFYSPILHFGHSPRLQFSGLKNMKIAAATRLR